MKWFLRFSMVGVVVLLGIGLFTRTAIGFVGSAQERWVGPTFELGGHSIGIGLRFARAAAEQSALDGNASSECTCNNGNLVVVMMSGETVAALDSAAGSSREE